MNIALIFAGGIGSRIGGSTPKQFLEWNGKAIIIQTLEVFDKHPLIDEIVVVCKDDWIEFTDRLINDANLKKVALIVPGGKTALDSQYNGLKEIKKLHETQNDIYVLVHDGVRPLIDSKTITKNIECAKIKGNAVTVANAIETVVTVNENDEIIDIYDRDYCRLARAPQTFRLDELLQAHEKTISTNTHNYIDSASLMKSQGYKLYTVLGEQENIKITTSSDYYMYNGIIGSKEKK